MSYKTHLIVVVMLVLAAAALVWTPTPVAQSFGGTSNVTYDPKTNNVTLQGSAPPTIVASPADQARIKPLIDAESKAREALLAKTATLPESTAVKAAKEAYDKALAGLNSAAEKLPEHAAWKEAGARALDEAYRIQAENKLSSRERKPELNAKGELVFTRIESPK